MPVHDGTRVEAAVFHSFHHSWIAEISHALNERVLPSSCYALMQQEAGGVSPNVWTLPSTISIRRVSSDDSVAMVDVISPSNKESRKALRFWVYKACKLIKHNIHLLLIDLLPPTELDPHGLHAALWDEIADKTFEAPAGKPLTVASYECALTTRAYVEPVAVGDILPDMPLFLEPDGCIHVPLEATYQAAFAKVPRRWRSVLEAASSE